MKSVEIKIATQINLSPNPEMSIIRKSRKGGQMAQ